MNVYGLDKPPLNTTIEQRHIMPSSMKYHFNVYFEFALLSNHFSLTIRKNNGHCDEQTELKVNNTNRKLKVLLQKNCPGKCR